MAKLISWLQQGVQVIGSKWRQAEQLLSPYNGRCLCCEQSIYLHSAYELPLCKWCYFSIPWITDVACPRCGRFDRCLDCERWEHIYFMRNRSAVRYDEQMRSWLALYKYRGDEVLKKVLGTMLLHAYQLHKLADESDQQALPALELLTFVPLSKERFLERGFNQAEQMAFELGGQTGLRVWPLLKRSRDTIKQSHQRRGERLSGLSGAFELDQSCAARLLALSKRHKVRIYIIDDVYTTGSTLNECAKMLRGSFMGQVCGITFARSGGHHV